ncbi:3-oxo-5-alpha-steroid 4-dehydrogenase 2b isoform X1 [Seriola aureovittata]|uniref:3-oxo-5-alpha-steroid 4-dehydrogenase 2b isoform X1 n=1 Tax=Seriola aureovittata TaxID=2871759 RepID=UPI0024BEE831|nr:3-oxo-5-alpha-steroid 4-dehydrogenase 2b isoform X1 [Seriola aureovittata]
MHCYEDLVNCLSCGIILIGLGHLVHHRKTQTSYGRHMVLSPPARTVPARLAWFLQEIPALLAPLLLMFTSHKPSITGKHLLLGTFCTHYFQRTFVYSLLTRGRPFPLGVMVAAGFFCTLNGFLQGHYLLHCAHFDEEWSADYRCKTGLVLFYVGMAINIHSDYILRNLRKPGEVSYKIPTGGLFEYVSGANYLGEIVEWFGFAVATWSLPALSFAVFSLSFIGPRAYYHHRCLRHSQNAEQSCHSTLILPCQTYPTLPYSISE